MTLKTATLIAFIGIALAYAMSLFSVVSMFHSSPIYVVEGALYHIPLLIFLFTLYRKQ